MFYDVTFLPGTGLVQLPIFVCKHLGLYSRTSSVRILSRLLTIQKWTSWKTILVSFPTSASFQQRIVTLPLPVQISQMARITTRPLQECEWNSFGSNRDHRVLLIIVHLFNIDGSWFLCHTVLHEFQDFLLRMAEGLLTFPVLSLSRLRLIAIKCCTWWTF